MDTCSEITKESLIYVRAYACSSERSLISSRLRVNDNLLTL